MEILTEEKNMEIQKVEQYEQIFLMKNAVAKEAENSNFEKIIYLAEKKALYATNCKILIKRKIDLGEDDFLIDTNDLLPVSAVKKLGKYEIKKLEIKGTLPDFDRLLEPKVGSVEKIKLTPYVFEKFLKCLTKSEKEEALNLNFISSDQPVIVTNRNFSAAIMPCKL